MKTVKARHPGPGSQRGQAATEYLVVGAFFIVVLVTAALGPSPLLELVAAIKEYFSAYSYAISITP